MENDSHCQERQSTVQLIPACHRWTTPWKLPPRQK